MQINKGPTHSVVNIDFLAQRNYNLTSVLTFIFRKFTDVRDIIKIANSFAKINRLSRNSTVNYKNTIIS